MQTPTEVIQTCRNLLKDHYGPKLQDVILHGSTARNQASAQSDIDLLVILHGFFDYFAELRQIIDLLYPVQLESEQLISARPVSVLDFEQGTIQLYRNAKREGITV